MTAPALQLLGVHKTFPGADRPVLAGASLTVAAGEHVAVVGPSGSGKSTLLQIAGLLDQAEAETHTLGPHDVRTVDEATATRLRRDHVGFVFQDHHLLPQLSALENALVPWLADHRRAPAQAVDAARDLLVRLGLGDRLDHRPHALSTGQRQRVAVARALARDPVLVLADEPTGALDPALAGSLVDVLFDGARGTAVLLVTHDPAVASRADRTLRLADGVLTPVDGR